VNLYGFVYNNPFSWIDIWGGYPSSNPAPVPKYDPGSGAYDPQYEINYKKIDLEPVHSDPDKAPNRCCDAATIKKGKDELRERYKKMMALMKKQGLKSHGRGKNSCKNRSADTMQFLQPVPKCWSCKEAAGSKWSLGWGLDHVWVECESNSADGSKPEYIAFDSWSGFKDFVKPSVIYSDYPYPLPYNSTVVFHNTCNDEQPYLFPELWPF
jgi:hypothetical protein